MARHICVACLCSSHFEHVTIGANGARFALTLRSEVLIGARRTVNLSFKSIFGESASIGRVCCLVTSFGRTEVSASTNSSSILVSTVEANGAIDAVVGGASPKRVAKLASLANLRRRSSLWTVIARGANDVLVGAGGVVRIRALYVWRGGRGRF